MCQASQVYVSGHLGATQKMACLNAGKAWRVTASTSDEVTVGRKMDNFRDRNKFIKKPDCKGQECQATRNVVLVAVDEPSVLPQTVWSLGLLHDSMKAVGANADLVLIATPSSQEALGAFTRGRQVCV